MEHFYKQINSKHFDIGKFSSSTVIVTLKVDGTPLQISFKNGSFSFHKRPKNEKTEGGQITRMEAFTNPAFYPIMKQLAPFLKNNIDKFNGVKLLNAEILIDNTHHVIQYKQKPKGNLCLLNGITINDKSIDQKMLQSYADILNIEVVPTIFSGVLNDKMQKLVEYVKQNCDPHNPNDTGSFKDDIIQILNGDNSSSLLDTVDGNIEGFVFDFVLDGSHQFYKIDSPFFVQHGITAREEGMSDDDVKKMNSALQNIYNYFQKKQFNFKKVDIDNFEGILQNFDTAYSQDSRMPKFLYDAGKSCKLSDMMHSTDVGMLPTKYQKYKNDEILLYALRIFVWLFGKKQTGKNYPILSKFESLMK